MRFGIDFGTTRIVVAAVDRGNFPLVGFESGDGAVRDWVPALVASAPGKRFYGWDAWAAQSDPSVTVVRSLKRVLGQGGPASRVRLGSETVSLPLLLGNMAADLARRLRDNSALHLKPGEPLEIMLGVPANANSNQRFLTVEAFRSAGFTVLGLLNEPSAASIEYVHRLEAAREEQILVYDLGGGTFDVSLVQCQDREHSVAATEGIPTLGGDDFDHVLADLALAASAHAGEALTQAEEFRLGEECREKKEAINPNTRRIVVDLDRVREGWGQSVIPIADYYARCAPLLEETLTAVEGVLQRAAHDGQVSLYITGGGSELPIVARTLRERYGRRVRRSNYTRSATAIGLAIQADSSTGYRLRERFTRFFGVWREAEGGQRIIFDPLFERDTQLPAPGEPALERRRVYQPAHNVGHFRYLECSSRAGSGEPAGEITQWDEIRFPFDPALSKQTELGGVAVESRPDLQGQWIEERYRADASGSLEVLIANRSAGYERSYRLGRWSPEAATVNPARPRRKRATG